MQESIRWKAAPYVCNISTASQAESRSGGLVLDEEHEDERGAEHAVRERGVPERQQRQRRRRERRGPRLRTRVNDSLSIHFLKWISEK